MPLVLALAGLLAACSSSTSRVTDGRSSRPRQESSATGASSTRSGTVPTEGPGAISSTTLAPDAMGTSTSTTLAQPPPSSTTTTVSPGELPQTSAFPSSTTAQFAGEMQALWRGIQTGSVETAMAAFFPLAAYLQVKAIPDPAADYADRLVAHFRLDLEAAHQLLVSQGGPARLLRVVVPDNLATWIPPGGCYNRVGYWHVPGARLVYEQGGVVRSFGIASTISWRGVWYVVHLGAEARTVDEGIVDDPTIGPGVPGPPGGC
jgi:hypothetical protein